ncbi:MAG: alpha/beta fold hydrolase [Gammaproteobacteria bacterium]
MPFLTVNGARLHYEIRGRGPGTLVFAHGLLFSGEMFAPQVAALSRQYRCVTFDFRGQGRSEVTETGYDMDTLTQDALGLIRSLNLAPCHFAGLSMGGFVAMRLAIRYPEMLESLVLMATSADPEPAENVAKYRALNFVSRWIGPGVVASRVMPIMFGGTFMEDPSRAALRKEMRRRIASNDRLGISRATAGVIDRQGVYESLGAISVPTLVIVGDEDIATTPAKAQRIHEAVPGSRLVTIPGAGHTATVEEPAAVTRAIADFLARNRRGGQR